MGQTKATKKFEKRHLSDTLKRRKEFSKVKQRHQVNAKRKAKRADEGDDEQTDRSVEPHPKRIKQNGSELPDMTVDDFFAAEVPLPERSASAKTALRKADKKRKRKEEEIISEEEDPGSMSDASEPPIFGSDDLTGSDDDGKDAAGMHADELKSLAAKDPEFYKYLQENDAELLDFAGSANLGEVDELSGGEDDVSGRTKKETRAHEANNAEGGDISETTVRKWTAAMVEQYSLRSMREVVLAFRAAAYLNEEDGKQYKYTISDASVYHEVIKGALAHIPGVLNHHLPIKELPNGKMRLAADSKKFRTLTPLLKSHTISLQHLLSNLSDPATMKLTLTSILELLPYILSFKKAVRELIRAVVEIWSDSAQTEAIRISAFLILRRLSTIGDPGIKEHVLRSTYQGLIKGSRSTTIYNLAGINLMKNSGLELWGLVEPQIAYTTGFTFIRQLAIHLRNSIKNNSNESYKSVYNWQYVHSLDFWSRALSTHCDTLKEATNGKESPLRPLIYPLTQVTLGAMRLIPTAAYFPLRFQLVRALLRLSAATNTFIPLAAPLYEVLQSAEMKKPPKPSTAKPLDFETNIRATKSYLRTRVYQDGIGEQVTELLGEYFVLWSRNIAFPELALPLVVMLKRWGKEVSPYHGASSQNSKRQPIKGSKKEENSKGNRNNKINTMVSILVQKLELNSRFIAEKRAKVDFAPNDRSGVDGFLKELEVDKTPLGAYVAGRRKQREEERRILEEGRRQEEAKRKQSSLKDVEIKGFESESEDAQEAVFTDQEDDEQDEDDEVELEMEDELEGDERDADQLDS